MFFHFRSNFEAAQPPILIDNMHAILENEKIERHIMKHIPGGHNLFVAGIKCPKPGAEYMPFCKVLTMSSKLRTLLNFIPFL